MPRRRHGLIVAVALLIAIAGLAAWLIHPSLKRPPEPGFAAPADPAEAHRQDLAYLKRALRAVDRSFTAEERRVFEDRIDALAREANKLDAPALELGVARAVAAADNGHTNVLGAARGLTLNSIPLRAYWFAEGLYVVKADAAHADLLGARVLKVAGRAPEAIARITHGYIGGSPNLARELSPYLIVSPQALRAIGLQASVEHVDIELVAPTGEVLRRRLVAASVPAAGPPPPRTAQTLTFDPRELVWPRRDLSPVGLPKAAVYPQPSSDGRAWVHLLDGRASAVSLGRPNSFYWSADLAGGAILFIQINATMDQPGREGLKAFLDRTVKEVARRRPRSVIVDLRANPGGSYGHTAAFARDLPARLPPDGKLYILTSGGTFSAALITAARLKHFAGGRAVIVGEPMGDRPRFWAEAATRVVLPNSGLRVGYATGYHDWAEGCSITQLGFCYPGNYLLAAPAGDLTPAIPVRWSFADYVQGRDTVVDRIEQLSAR